MAKQCLATVKVTENTVTADVIAQNTGNTTLSDMYIECSLKPPSGDEINFRGDGTTNVQPQGLLTRSFSWIIDNTYTQVGTWTVYARLYINNGATAVATESCPFTLELGAVFPRIVESDIAPQPIVLEGSTLTASMAVKNEGLVSGDFKLRMQFYDKLSGVSMAYPSSKNFYNIPVDGTTDTYSVSWIPTNANAHPEIVAVYRVWTKDASGAWKTTPDLEKEGDIVQVARSGEPECALLNYSTNPAGNIVYKGQSILAEAKYGNQGTTNGNLTFEIRFTDDNDNTLNDYFVQPIDVPVGWSDYKNLSYTVPSNYPSTYVYVHFIGYHDDGVVYTRLDFDYVKKLKVQ
jgi:hypothetical protein